MIEFPQCNEKIHIIGFLGGNPKLQAHVPDQLSILFERIIKYCLATGGFITGLALLTVLIKFQPVIRCIEIQLFVFGP